MRSASLRVPFVDLVAAQGELGRELRDVTDAVAARADWILGEEVSQFESEFAAYCGARYGVGTDSGLSALSLVLLSLGVEPGDEVITAAHTFAATAFAISNIGAVPVFVDVDPTSYAIDPVAVEAAISNRTSAIIAVHLYGHPAPMDALGRIARRHHLALIEDASQAHGARYGGRRVGSLADAAAFSLYPSKNLGAHGDAGVIVTDLLDVAERAKVLRNYGQRRKHEHECVGFNHRLDTLQAAILRVKLRHLDVWNDLRRAHAVLYSDLLADCDVTLPTASVDVEHVWHLYVVQLDARDALARHLEECGIATGIHYPRPAHLLPPYAHLGLERGPMQVSEAAAARVLSLPMYPQLERSAIEHVCARIDEFRPSRSQRPASFRRDRSIEARR